MLLVLVFVVSGCVVDVSSPMPESDRDSAWSRDAVSGDVHLGDADPDERQLDAHTDDGEIDEDMQDQQTGSSQPFDMRIFDAELMPSDGMAVTDAGQVPSPDMAVSSPDMAVSSPDMAVSSPDMDTTQDLCRMLRLDRNDLRVFGFGYLVRLPTQRSGCASEMSAVEVLRLPNRLSMTWTFWVEALTEGAPLRFRTTIPSGCTAELRINGSVFRMAENISVGMNRGETVGEYVWACEMGNPAEIQRLRVVLE